MTDQTPIVGDPIPSNDRGFLTFAADLGAPELTAEEARELADDLGIELYRAQDALAFVEECCRIADRKSHQVTTADVREWLKGARCGRQLLADDDEVRALAEDRRETQQAHNQGEHGDCGLECEATMPSEQMRNAILCRAIPGSATMLDELLRRATAGQAAASEYRDDVRDANAQLLRRMAAEAQHPGPEGQPAEDPARIDRLRPEFDVHASVESIGVQLRRAQRQRGLWDGRARKLDVLRETRQAQMEAGTWPPAASAIPAAPETEAQRCGKTQSVSGIYYRPCARDAGHSEAYCRSADGEHLFLAAPETETDNA